MMRPHTTTSALERTTYIDFLQCTGPLSLAGGHLHARHVSLAGAFPLLLFSNGAVHRDLVIALEHLRQHQVYQLSPIVMGRLVAFGIPGVYGTEAHYMRMQLLQRVAGMYQTPEKACFN